MDRWVSELIRVHEDVRKNRRVSELMRGLGGFAYVLKMCIINGRDI